MEFLAEFKSGLALKEINGMLFDTLDKDRSTKEKSVIMDKMNILETLLRDYLYIKS